MLSCRQLPTRSVSESHTVTGGAAASGELDADSQSSLIDEENKQDDSRWVKIEILDTL